MISRLLDWAVLKIFPKHDIIEMNGDPYMRRWMRGKKDGYGIRLHHVLRSDGDREHHDHPFSFVTFILRGGYTEHRPGHPPVTYRAPAILYRRAEDLHRLELSSPAWTFVIRGPYKRDWGFMSYDGTWYPSSEFFTRNGNVNIAREP